jgi:predicted enzyme related to lactoylglutathione lyase
MRFASIRLVTHQIDALVDFYAALTGVQANRPAPLFAEFPLPGATLAISVESVVTQYNAGAVVAGANRSSLIEFEVDDVPAAMGQLPAGTDVVMKPTTMPWGNVSMLIRDPDGNVINIFSRPRG